MSLPPIESMFTLAHTLYTTPGSHALIIGAGVSAPAGVLSAWEVQVRLIQQLADLERAGRVLDNKTAHRWFKDKYGVKAPTRPSSRSWHPPNSSGRRCSGRSSRVIPATRAAGPAPLLRTSRSRGWRPWARSG